MAPWHDQRSSANAYHSSRIVVNGTLVEYWIDERQVLGCDLASEELRERIARSRSATLRSSAGRAKVTSSWRTRGTEGLVPAVEHRAV